MKSLTDILKELNELDENPRLEAKACRNELGQSFFESVCAFANEPGLGGGILILGVSRVEDDMFGAYEVTGVTDPDKLSLDIASGCASKFNCRIRPQIETVDHQDKVILLVEIPESSATNKPIFFKKLGLPKGARRRIGSSDQKCDEDDLQVLFAERGGESYDLTPIPSASTLDFDEDAIAHYRNLLAKAGSDGEMLAWDDEELLQSIKAVREHEGQWRPTLLGLLLFGKRSAHRRELPMVRIDYIRVPGKTWVEDPNERFTKSYDMRGPVLRLIERALATVVDDLPKGFELPEGSVQAKTPGLPINALREAIVNAVMHRSYRVDSPIQIIRFSNRIEINNAGFSLKNEDRWLKPGSEHRNTNLAAIFHETNTAETKGTGISYMRKKMIEAGFSPPTFDSNRGENRFSSEFFLHHFLSEEGLGWLAQIQSPLSEGQKYALIAVRESLRVDNRTLRQLTGNDVFAASTDLRKLCTLEMLEKQGAGSATYYIKGAKFPPGIAPEVGEFPPDANNVGDNFAVEHNGEHKGEAVLNPEASTPNKEAPGLNPEASTLNPEAPNCKDEPDRELPAELARAIQSLGVRPREAVNPVILALCRWRVLTTNQIAAYLGRRDSLSLQQNYLRPLIQSGKLQYLYPESEKHPKQAYRTPETS